MKQEDGMEREKHEEDERDSELRRERIECVPTFLSIRLTRTCVALSCVVDLACF